MNQRTTLLMHTAARLHQIGIHLEAIGKTLAIIDEQPPEDAECDQVVEFLQASTSYKATQYAKSAYRFLRATNRYLQAYLNEETRHASPPSCRTDGDESTATHNGTDRP